MNTLMKGNFMCKIKDLICSREFDYLQPYFYNNPYVLRCELGIGAGDEYMKSAYKRALEIFNILFDTIPDAIFFNYWLTDYSYTTGEIEADTDDWKRIANTEKHMLKRLITYQQKYRHIAVKNLSVYSDPETIKRHRIVCFSDGKQFKYKKLIKEQIEERGFDTSFVSFKNGCILSIYDDRGCDVVFAEKDKMKAFYPLLEPYFLDYDKAEMERRYKE